MEPFRMPFDYGTWKDIRRLRRGEAAVVEDIARAATADLEVSLDPPTDFFEASSSLEHQPFEHQGAEGRPEGQAGLQAWQKLVLKVRLRRQEVTAFGKAHGVHELLQRIKREGPDVSILDTGSLNLRSLYEQVIEWRLEEGGLLRGRLERALGHVHSLELRHAAAMSRLSETRREKGELEARFKAEGGREGDVRLRLRGQALGKDMIDLQAEACRVQGHCDRGRREVQELAAQLEVLDADIERVGLELANLQPSMAGDPEAPPPPPQVHSPRTAYVLLRKAREKDEKAELKGQLASERAARRELEAQWGEVSRELEQRWKDVLHKFKGLQVENAALQARLGEETVGRAQLRERCEAMAVELLELRQHKEGFGETLRVLRQEREEAQAEAERNGMRGAKLRQELEALRLEKEQADARLVELQQHRESVGKTLRALRQEREEALAEAERGRQERAGLEQEIKTLQHDKGAVDAELWEQTDRLTRKQAAAERLISDKAEVEAGLVEQARAAEEREAELRRRIETLEREGERLRAELEALRAQAQDLRQEREEALAEAERGRREALQQDKRAVEAELLEAELWEQKDRLMRQQAAAERLMFEKAQLEAGLAEQARAAEEREAELRRRIETLEREGEPLRAELEARRAQAAGGEKEAASVSVAKDRRRPASIVTSPTVSAAIAEEQGADAQGASMVEQPTPVQELGALSRESTQLPALAADGEVEANDHQAAAEDAPVVALAAPAPAQRWDLASAEAERLLQELKAVEDKKAAVEAELRHEQILRKAALKQVAELHAARQAARAELERRVEERGREVARVMAMQAARAAAKGEQEGLLLSDTQCQQERGEGMGGGGNPSMTALIDAAAAELLDQQAMAGLTGVQRLFDTQVQHTGKQGEVATPSEGGGLGGSGFDDLWDPPSVLPRKAAAPASAGHSGGMGDFVGPTPRAVQQQYEEAESWADSLLAKQASNKSLLQSGEVSVDLSGGHDTAPRSGRLGYSTLGTSASSGMGGSMFDTTGTGSDMISMASLEGFPQVGKLVATLDNLRQEEQRLEAQVASEEEAGRTLERRQGELQRTVAEIIGEQARDADLDRSAARDVLLEGVCKDMTCVVQELEASGRRREQLLGHHAALVERRDSIEAAVERRRSEDRPLFLSMVEDLVNEGAAAQLAGRTWSADSLLSPAQASGGQASPDSLDSSVSSSEVLSPNQVHILRARIAMLEDEAAHLREENAQLVKEREEEEAGVRTRQVQRGGEQDWEAPPRAEAHRPWSPVSGVVSPRGVVGQEGEEGDMEAAWLREEEARRSMRGEEARLLSRVTELEQQERAQRDTLSEGAEVLAGRQRVAGERQQLLTRMAQLQARRSELEASALSALARVRQVQGQLRGEAQRRREAEEKLAKSREEAAGLKRAVGEVEAKLGEQEEQVAALEAQRRGMEQEVSKLDEENAELLERLLEGDRRQVELERQKEAHDGRRSPNKLLTPRRRGLLDRASEVSVEKEVLQERLRAEEERRAELEAALTEQLHAAVAENEALAEKIRVTEGGKLDVLSELMTLRQAVSDLSVEKAGLQTQLRAVVQQGEGGGSSGLQVEQLLGEKRDLKGRVRELERAKNAMEGQMIAVTYQLRTKLQQLEEVKRAKAEVEERVATLSQGVRGEEGLQKQLQALTDRCTSLEAQRAQNEESMAKLSREKAELELQLRQAVAREGKEELGGARRKALVAKVKQLQDERDALECRLKEAHEAQRASEGEKGGLEEQLAALGRRLAEAEEERALLHTHVVELEQEGEGLRQATQEGLEEAEAMRRYSDELEARERSRSEQAEQDVAWQHTALALAHERMERDKETLQGLLESERATTQRQGREVEGLRVHMARLLEEKAKLEAMLRAGGTGAGGEGIVLLDRGSTDKASDLEDRDRARTNNAAEVPKKV